jgi:hypothetical protein
MIKPHPRRAAPGTHRNIGDHPRARSKGRMLGPRCRERFSHESDSDGHGQMLFRASSADGRQGGRAWTA